MRMSVLAAAVVLLFGLGAPQLSATEVDRPAAPAELATPTVDGPEAVGELNLTKVQVEERANADDAALVQPARGSFWWLVGVIVVAGVILAVVL